MEEVGRDRAPRARAFAGQPKEAEMTTPQSPQTPDAGSTSTGFKNWWKGLRPLAQVAIGVTTMLVVTSIIIALVVLAARFLSTGPKMEVLYTQKLTPAGSQLPSGTAVVDGRLQCGSDATKLVLKKDGTVKSPKGDTVKAKWTRDSVIITISGSPIQDVYKSVIFDGKNTVIAAIASVRSDATDVTLTGNFAKEFKDSAPAKAATVCIGK